MSASQNIKMVDLGATHKRYKSEIETAIQLVIDSERFIGGSEVSKFEESFAKYNNVKHIVSCGNGTDALQIALMSLELEPGSEVIVPSFSFVATAEAVAICGLIPVFVDVDPRNFTIDTNKIDDCVTNNTSAIIAVNLYGQNANIELILKIARKYGLKVIEDSAQSVGSIHIMSDKKQLKSGTAGDIGAVSFFPSKNLGGYGDGGAILTNNEDLATKCRQIASHGHEKKYYSVRLGLNSRLDPLQAAVLNVKLKHLDEFNIGRSQKADLYYQYLNNCKGITLPLKVNWSNHIFHQFTLIIKEGKRDDLKEYLSKAGIPTMIYYPYPIHRQPAYENYSAYKLTNSEYLAENVLSLPVHPELDESDQLLICNKVNQFFN